MTPQVDLVKIGKVLGFSLSEGRKGRESSTSSNCEGPKQACVYRYHYHSDHVVQLLPPSAEARVIFTGYHDLPQLQLPADRKSTAVAF
ncbi:hypothetical protein A4A49_37013 [Nicotiana attenuata]|uniref:Uncharacterized protein n=1 Tax=Nicotiana attenuata TaxID=49451 RepID=A0A1J6JWE2_NICAT|nr:hypothetical protein A4A49_37013 [Nicotiana attenuata]